MGWQFWLLSTRLVLDKNKVEKIVKKELSKFVHNLDLHIITRDYFWQKLLFRQVKFKFPSKTC